MGIDYDSKGNLVSVGYTFSTINNQSDPASLDVDKGECITLNNVDIIGDTDGPVSAQRRPGSTIVHANACHSGWTSLWGKAYYVRNGIIYEYNGAEKIVGIIGTDDPVTFCDVNDIIAVSNGTVFGVIEGGVFSTGYTPSGHFKIPMVAGQAMAFYNGKLYMAKDNVLYVSDVFDSPGAIQQMDERFCVAFVYDSRITGVIECADCLFVGTTKEIFLHKGDDNLVDGGNFNQITQADYGMVEGTAKRIHFELVGDRAKNTGYGAMFASHRGLCFCGTGGIFENMSQEYFQYPYGDRGTAIVRQQGGNIHYISILDTTQDTYNQQESKPITLDAA